MNTSGSKQEITSKIAVFLETGDIKRPLRKTKPPAPEALQKELSLETVITEHHRYSQAVRAFYKAVFPNFHFSTYIQNCFKKNSGKTYRGVANAWHEEHQRFKNPAYKTDIAPQFEYNQFIRDSLRAHIYFCMNSPQRVHNRCSEEIPIFSCNIPVNMRSQSPLWLFFITSCCSASIVKWW
ncbi:SAP domain-containing protein [Domibacillus sp. PGB-M46]|nr:SAP domain-containing protein [Domibacillus sp. PGB-M46]